jgi:hypothetical protein
MRWGIAMKNLEVDKWQLITPDMSVDEDDPRYGDEVHIAPVVEDSEYLSFGVHDFKANCACHPEIDPHCGGRTIIKHKAAVN